MTKIVAIFMIGVLFFNISINCFPQVIDPVNQAKADASADMSQRSWFLLGAFLPLSPIIGCLAGSAVNNTSSGSLVIGLPNDTQFGGAITLGLTGCLVLPLSISKMPIRPSPEKLLGKSPEYIRTYSKTYREETKKLRENWGIRGIACGTGVACLLTLGFF